MSSPETKTCCVCKEEKPLSEFSPNGLRKGVQQYRSSCRLCYSRAALKNYHRRMRGEGPGGPLPSPIIDGKKRCSHCGEMKLEREFNRNPKNKLLYAWCRACTHEGLRLKKYGISITDYERMFTQQNGVCAICRRPERNENRYGLLSLSVDHDHKTGKVRGLLCQDCNRGLGQFKDDPVLVRSAADYLERSR